MDEVGLGGILQRRSQRVQLLPGAPNQGGIVSLLVPVHRRDLCLIGTVRGVHPHIAAPLPRLQLTQGCQGAMLYNLDAQHLALCLPGMQS